MPQTGFGPLDGFYRLLLRPRDWRVVLVDYET